MDGVLVFRYIARQHIKKPCAKQSRRTTATVWWPRTSSQPNMYGKHPVANNLPEKRRWNLSLFGIFQVFRYDGRTLQS